MKKTIIMLAAISFSSCHIYKKYERPDTISAEGVYREVTTASDDSTSMANLSWREIFTDPQLQALIDTALQNNVDMQKAKMNIDIATAALKMNRRAFAPSVTLNPSGTLGRVSAGDKANEKLGGILPITANNYNVPLVVSWEADIFGKVLNAKRASKVQLLQSEEYAQAVKCNLIAAVANYYYSLLVADKQLQITEETVANWENQIETMKSMKLAGMLNEAAIAQSEAQCTAAKINALDLKKNIQDAENALCILLNTNPKAIERSTIDEQQMPEITEIGVPATLLANRPDVRMAEYTLANAYYNTNSARAAFYPGITITGTGAWLNNATGAIINPGQLMLSAAGSMLMPLFAKGQLTANLKTSKIKEEQASLDFQKSILNAGKEVSDAFYAYNYNKSVVELRSEYVEQLQRAEEATTSLLQLGSSTYLEVLTAQQSLLRAQQAVENDKLAQLQAVINLYKALGGGRN
ncbi:MAG: efflux transporter outer membrane subunit [Bacteroidales bacterium]|nr:efflux transporter outer membrane subunit [Bacteroidales bacterium]